MPAGNRENLEGSRRVDDAAASGGVGAATTADVGDFDGGESAALLGPSAPGGGAPTSERRPSAAKAKLQAFSHWFGVQASNVLDDQRVGQVQVNPLESLTEGAHYHRDARILRSSFQERMKDMYEFLAGKVTDWQFQKGQAPTVHYDMRMGLLSFILPAELLLAKAAKWGADAENQLFTGASENRLSIPKRIKLGIQLGVAGLVAVVGAFLWVVKAAVAAVAAVVGLVGVAIAHAALWRKAKAEKAALQASLADTDVLNDPVLATTMLAHPNAYRLVMVHDSWRKNASDGSIIRMGVEGEAREGSLLKEFDVAIPPSDAVPAVPAATATSSATSASSTTPAPATPAVVPPTPDVRALRGMLRLNLFGADKALEYCTAYPALIKDRAGVDFGADAQKVSSRVQAVLGGCAR